MPRLLVELTGGYIRRSCYMFLLLGALGGGWWVFAAPHHPVIVHPTTTLAIQAACEKVMKALPPQEVGLQDTLVLELANDRRDDSGRELVSEALREAFANHGGYRLVEKSRTDRMREWASNQINISALKSGPVTDAETALHYANWAEADYVVFGNVNKLQQPVGGAEDQPALIDFNMHLLSVQDGKTLLDGAFSSRSAEEPETPIKRLSTAPTQSWYGTAVAFFATVWPLSLTTLMRRVLRVENNQLTLFTLLMIIAVPVALGWPWAFGADASVWRTIFFVIGAAFVALWCSFIMSRVAEMNKY